MYIITAATGNIGKALSSALLANGKKVRVIGRSADNLKELAEKGAETMVGDVMDATFVSEAFAGGTAAFCLIPPVYQSTDFRADQHRVASNYLKAVKYNKIPYVILLSSIGAHLRNGAGVVDGLGDMEELFTGLKEVNVLNLRPSYFLENLFTQLSIIRQWVSWDQR
ncbi:MAG: NAD(P)H-binding protein [Bacteroidota bacterium]